MSKHGIKFVVLFIVLFAGCGADLYTKQLAKNNLQGNSEKTIIQGYMEFSYTENDGMVFGLLSSKASNVKQYALTGLTSVSILFIIFLIWRLRTLAFLYHLPFFLILAGAFPNLIDRIRYGQVVDFIHIHWKDSIDWPFLFNVADALICIGATLLFFVLVFRGKVIDQMLHAKKKIM